MDDVTNMKQSAEQIAKKIPSDQATIKEVDLGPIVLLDSSFLLAYMDPSDANHKIAQAIYSFLQPFTYRVQLPLVVLAEALSKIVHKKGKVSLAIKAIDNFTKNTPGTVFVGNNLDYKGLVERYKKCARKSMKMLQSNDFMIVTEGMLSEATILTCDYVMYKRVKDHYPNIFFVATNSNNYKDGATRFMSTFLEKVNKELKKTH